MKATGMYRNKTAEKQIIAMYEQFLMQGPCPVEQMMIPTRHGETFCIAGGDPAAPPVILIHGSGSNTLAWGGELAEYCRHFRVYAVDIPGEPGKSAPNRPSLDGPAYADWLLDIVTYLQVPAGRLSIVGLSMGGWMGIKFAVAYPEHVGRLVLLSPGGISQGKLSFFLRLMFWSLFGDNGMKKGMRIASYPETVHPEVEEFMLLIARNFRHRPSLPLFSEEELQELKMPVMLRVGALDTLLPARKSAERLGKLLPHADLKIIPDAGHMVFRTSEAVSFLQS